ncbi:MAG: DUF4233 domain-containing protein [Terrimesophilobacter sp.]
MTEQAPRVRRERTATESLLSIVLGLEAALMFFVTVTAVGLKVLDTGWVLGGGAVLFVLFIIAAWLVRYPSGVWLGWLLQVALIATGMVMTLMYFIGAGFAALWVYCFITALRLDRTNFPKPSFPKTNSPKTNPTAKEAS